MENYYLKGTSSFDNAMDLEGNDSKRINVNLGIITEDQKEMDLGSDVLKI